MGAYTIRLFGGFAVEEPFGAKAPALPQRRAEAMLAILAVYGSLGCSRERLMALLWPESDERHGRHHLRDALYAIHRAYGSTAVLTEGDIVRLDPGTLRSDVQQFAAALAEGRPADAVAAYGGAFLDGFHVAGSAELERWIDDERARLFRDYQLALKDLAKKAEDGEGWDAAAEWWGRLLAADPYNSRAAVRRMVALARSGDRANAIKEGEAHCRRLKAELELDPDPALLEELERIRGGVLEPSYFSSPLETTAAAGLAEEIRKGQPQQPERVEAPAQRGTAAAEGNAHGPNLPAGIPAAPSLPEEHRRLAPRAGLRYGLTAGEPILRPAAGARPERRHWLGRPRRRRMVGVAALLTAAAAVAAAGVWIGAQRRGETIHAHRLVVVPFENRTGDASLAPVGEMAADWITQGLIESGIVEVADGSAALALARGTGSATGLSEADRLRLFARETGSGLVVTGGYYLKGDSVALAARVVSARSGKLLGAVGPVFAPRVTPALGVQPLRQRVLAALAAQLDERLAAYQPLYVQPPSYDAYAEYMAGLRAEVVDDQWGEAFRHYDRAFTLDTTFYRAVMAAAWAAFIGGLDESDAYRARVEKVRDRLSTLDRYWLEIIDARRAYDCHAQYGAVRKMYRLTPGSDMSVWYLALTAGYVFRYHESLSLLRRLDPDRALAPHQYWTFLSGAQHVLGDFKGQLRAAAEMARRSPASPVPPALRLSALAALGRAPEARALAFALAERLARDTSGQRELSYVESLGFPGFYARSSPVPLFLAARELLAHGHVPGARALAHEAVRWCAERPLAEREDPGFRWMQAQLLTLDGRWMDADTLLAATDPPARLQPAYRWTRALIAARLGDRARALELGRQLQPLYVRNRPELELRLATLAGALGDRGEVLRRLRAIHAAGTDYGIWWLHTEPALLPYLREPEFRALLLPDD